MSFSKTLISGILAGCCIAIGGTIYLTVGGPLGAALFTVGLFCVCTMGFSLYTGKVCYVFDNDKKYALNLIPIWLGNLIGTSAVAIALQFTRAGSALIEKAGAICAVKLGDKLLSIFILAMLCNVMIYVGVESYRSNPHEVGKYVGLFLGIMVFILCGFEHCVANMYYFTIAGAWSGKAVLYLLVMTAGNAAGGILAHEIRKLIK